MGAANPLLHLAEAISALGRADASAALTEMARAVAADPTLAAVADAVGLAASQLEADAEIPAATWNALADVCPAELRGDVEQARG